MTPIFTLERYCYAESCAMGVLRIRGKKFYTIERPWLGNRRNVSCIPEGLFRCYSYTSGKHGETYEIDVPDRTYILFHVGNKADDVQGCIAIADSADSERFAIYNSVQAMKRFREELSGIEEFNLYITQYRPTML